MRLKSLESRVHNPRYKTGYTKWEKVGIYVQAALAAAVLASIGMYISCADNTGFEKPKVESVQTESQLETELQ